jgi:DNA repair exonuclease SbcCD nuclease subunit
MTKKKSDRVAIITDTHFGIRKGSQIFHDYFERFYSETFFPTLDKEGIDTVIHMGDVFDVRKAIDYWSLEWAKRVFFDPLRERGIQLHIIVGNHDIFYKQSTKLNSPSINLAEYTNITTYASPQTAKIKGTDVFMIPWVCEENAEEFIAQRNASKAKVAMGHLEIAGFYANATYQVQHGMDINNFSQFNQVFSGHFHKRSTSGNVSYLGNAYQLYWNDEGEDRGFNLYDLKSGEVEWVKNPNRMFNKIYYNEEQPKLINPNKFKDTYVKLIVEGKSTPRKLNILIDKLQKVGIHDLKVIDNFIIEGVEGEENIESEDTLTTLTNYVKAMEDVDTEGLVNIFKSLYVEAQEV